MTGLDLTEKKVHSGWSVCTILIDRTTTPQIHLRGEEARKTIEDMHAVWTMENEEAHDAGRE